MSKVCDKCRREYSGFGSTCGKCRRFLRTQGSARECRQCGAFSVGFSEECEECQNGRASTLPSTKAYANGRFSDFQYPQRRDPNTISTFHSHMKIAAQRAFGPDWIKAFAQMDKDRSGQITWEEFRSFCRVSLHLVDDEVNLMQFFRQFDKDGSGSISIDELISFVDDPVTRMRALLKAATYQQAGDEWANYLRSPELSNDGILNWNDFCQLCRSRLHINEEDLPLSICFKAIAGDDERTEVDVEDVIAFVGTTVSSMNEPLHVTIIGCRGLESKGFMGMVETFATVEVLGKHLPQKKVRTPLLNMAGKVTWNHTGYIADYINQEYLLASVWIKRGMRKDDLMGRAKIVVADVYPNGFQGEVQLHEGDTVNRRGEALPIFLTLHIKKAVHGAQVASPHPRYVRMPDPEGSEVSNLKHTATSASAGSQLSQPKHPASNADGGSELSDLKHTATSASAGSQLSHPKHPASSANGGGTLSILKHTSTNAGGGNLPSHMKHSASNVSSQSNAVNDGGATAKSTRSEGQRLQFVDDRRSETSASLSSHASGRGAEGPLLKFVDDRRSESNASLPSHASGRGAEAPRLKFVDDRRSETSASLPSQASGRGAEASAPAAEDLQIVELRQGQEAAEREIAELRQGQGAAEREIAELKRTVEALRRTIAEKDAQLAAKENENAKLRHDLAQAQSKPENLKVGAYRMNSLKGAPKPGDMAAKDKELRDLKQELEVFRRIDRTASQQAGDNPDAYALARNEALVKTANDRSAEVAAKDEEIERLRHDLDDVLVKYNAAVADPPRSRSATQDLKLPLADDDAPIDPSDALAIALRTKSSEIAAKDKQIEYLKQELEVYKHCSDICVSPDANGRSKAPGAGGDSPGHGGAYPIEVYEHCTDICVSPDANGRSKAPGAGGDSPGHGGAYPSEALLKSIGEKNSEIFRMDKELTELHQDLAVMRIRFNALDVDASRLTSTKDKEIEQLREALNGSNASDRATVGRGRNAVSFADP